VVNCSADHCPLVEAILDYARDNLVMFNIFIKVVFFTWIEESCCWLGCDLAVDLAFNLAVDLAFDLAVDWLLIWL
jgi:hypothetical protein